MKLDTDMDQRVLHTSTPNIKIPTWFQVNLTTYKDLLYNLYCINDILTYKLAGSMAFKMGHMYNSGSFGQLIHAGDYSATRWEEDSYKMAANASAHLHTHGHADSTEVMTGPTPAYP